jgi:hypothetical protein
MHLLVFGRDLKRETQAEINARTWRWEGSPEHDMYSRMPGDSFEERIEAAKWELGGIRYLSFGPFLIVNDR